MARKLKKKFRIALIALITAILLTIAGIFYWGTPEAPDLEISKAGKAIGEARKIISPDFIPQSLQDAQILYDSAMFFWKTENKKFILKRNYSRTRSLAIRSEKLALVSPGLAEKNTTDFIRSLEGDIKALKNDTSNIEVLYSRLPASAIINKKYTKGIMLLKEAELNLEQRKFKESRKKLDLAKADLSLVVSYTNSLLDDYFTNVPKWKRWAEQAIRQSAQNQDFVIIVDKFAAECYVYRNGALNRTFNAELGKNWIGHKRYAGDKATPEGFYKVTKKKNGSNTKYYRALLLNYPNNEDRQRFQEAIRNKTLPRSANIGSLIEIHGGGGQGVNWTDGCVALKNEEMDKLYRMVPEGCPVLIVGSLHPLKEVLKKPRP